jgi:predicted outer membrane repeat protein
MRHSAAQLVASATLGLLLKAAPAYAVNPTIFVDRFDDVAGLPCTSAPNDCSLRSAIQVANVTPGPDTIRLPPGTYTLKLFPADNDSTFNGAVAATGDLDIFDADGDPTQVSDLTINGSGSSVTLIQAGAIASQSIDRIFDVENVYGSPSAEGLNFTLTGVTLRNGWAPSFLAGNGIFTESGGAINFDGCHFTLTDCTSRGVLRLNDVVIDGNQAEASGGGIFAQNTGLIDLAGVVFKGNSAGGAGGALFHVGSTHDGSIQIGDNSVVQSSFTNNTTLGGNGGAIRLGPISSTSSVSIKLVAFTSNRAAVSGGAISIENGRATTVSLSSFQNNSAILHGGAIYSDAQTASDLIELSDIDFNANTADAVGNSAGDGGAVFVADGEVRIIESLLRNNVANSGGALAAEATGGSPLISVRNATITGNSAGALGGGLFVGGTGGAAALTNVTLAANRANTHNISAPGGYGGGVARVNGSVLLQNTIVAGNFNGASPSTAQDDGKASGGVTADYSLIQDTANFTFGGAHNTIGQSPRLGSLQNNGGPLMTMPLLAGSAAFDAGSNAIALAAGLTTDQRGFGYARSVDGPDHDTNAVVDCGAFEADPSIQDIPDLTINEDAALGIAFDIADTSLAQVVVSATSSNPTLVPNGNISLSGNGSTRFLTVSPLPNQSGATTITVTASASLPLSVRAMTDTFVLTVNPVDDPPVAASVTVPAFPQDSGAHTVGLSATDIDSTTLTFSIVTPPSKGTLGAIGAAACSGSPTTCTATVSYTPNGCAVGSDSFTYRAIDATGGGAPATVNLTMTATTPPSITQHPSNVSVPSTYYATFQAAADGCSPAVQWQVSATSGATWTDIVGATSTTYSFVTALGDSGKWFRAVFTNSVSSAVTNPATLTVIPHGPPDRADFTGDGKADIVWQHPDTGAVLLWEMNGSTYVSSTMLNAGGTLWQIVGVGDFTGDGKADLVWQHPATGAVLLWEMNGTAYVSSRMLNEGGTLWKVVAVADMNGDGKPDVIWQHPDTGAVLLWIMNGAAYSSGIVLNAGGTLWKVVGAADFTGDGQPDLLWQDPASGAVLLWTMTGATYAGSTLVNPGGTLWKIVANGDYTGDGKVDVLWQLPSTGALLLWEMNDATYVGSISVTNGGTLWKIAGPR